MSPKNGRYRASFEENWKIVSIPFGYDQASMDNYLSCNLKGVEWYWRVKNRVTDFAFIDKAEAAKFKMIFW
ncbi:hypothetical protein [Azospirillum argentinense]